MSTKSQTDNELTEDQVLNFVVNSLDEEFEIDFGENADIEIEDIHEGSVTYLCEIS